MPLSANGSNLLIGRGRWFFDRFDASGNPTGFRFLGEANKGEVTASVTTKERYTTTKATNVKIANIPTQQKHNLAIDLMEFVKDNVALALLGDTGVFTQAQTTVANETLAGGVGQAPPAAGRTYITANRGITSVTMQAVAASVAFTGTTASASPTVTGVSSTSGLVVGQVVTGTGIASSTTIAAIGSGTITLSANATASGTGVALTAGGASATLVAGTDFQLEDSNSGMITLLSSTAAAAKTITVGYMAAAMTSSTVTAGTSANIKGAFKFVADPTSGPAMNVHIWKTEVTPNGALALLSDDFASMTLMAEILDDSANHPAAPLYQVVYPNG